MKGKSQKVIESTLGMAGRAIDAGSYVVRQILTAPEVVFIQDECLPVRVRGFAR